MISLYFYPLLINRNVRSRIVKISFKKKEGIIEKNSYEHRAYISRLTMIAYLFSYISKFDGIKISSSNGLIFCQHTIIMKKFC